MTKKKSDGRDLSLSPETIIEVIKITPNKNYKKEMSYSKALDLLDEKRAAGSKDRYIIYQLGFSGYKDC